MFEYAGTLTVHTDQKHPTLPLISWRPNAFPDEDLEADTILVQGLGWHAFARALYEFEFAWDCLLVKKVSVYSNEVYSYTGSGEWESA